LEGEDEDQFDKLLKEIDLLRSLRNNHFIQFYNSWLNQDNTILIFISELMVSGSLRRYSAGFSIASLLLILLAF
jgi:hypothetical protein